MNSDDFLLLYPVFLLGKYPAGIIQADPDLRQRYAITTANEQAALLIFTERELAERMMMVEGLAANVISIGSPVELADVIHQNRPHLEIVLVDPNLSTKMGRGFPVDPFLRELER